MSQREMDMTDKTKTELLEELERTQATLARYKEYMRVVNQKSRSNRDISDALFGVIRNYKVGLRDE
jgi:predicted mannosyl-3-phosphoglycerate phosphatase (HAD superfamily)